MRRFVSPATLLAMITFTAVSVFGTVGASTDTIARPPVQPSVRSENNVGPWAVGCGIASAGSLMIGTAIHAGDKNDPRQLTINEAGWHSAACPFLLPWALIAQATCPDNKATDQVARLAFRFLEKHPGGDQSPFTAAYGEACRDGKLARKTIKTLNGLI